MTTKAPGSHSLEADRSEKCAHPSCTCVLAPGRPFGKYCGEHCADAGEMDELRCECGHDACGGGESPAAR